MSGSFASSDNTAHAYRLLTLFSFISLALVLPFIVSSRHLAFFTIVF